MARRKIAKIITAVTGDQISAAGFSETTSEFCAAPYGSPCPPAGKPHRYVFTAYALKVVLQ